MYLTGFADEGARGIDDQIRATQELGWRFIESRSIDGKNLHDIPDEDFDQVERKLAAAGVSVNCFGSAIGNWSKSVDDPPDTSYAEARRAAPRMQRLGTKLVRIMSFTLRKGYGPDEQLDLERFKRLREIVKIFRDAGLQPVHENCMNYGGMGHTFTLRMLENVPGLRLVFDTGNPTHDDDMQKPADENGQRPKQSSWEFYSNVREFIDYVHIKDAVWYPAEQKTVHTFPGEGQGDVKRVVEDLLKNGYDGGFSMEPHMQVVFHEGDQGAEAKARFDNYVEYGRRFMRLLADLGRLPKEYEPALAKSRAA